MGALEPQRAEPPRAARRVQRCALALLLAYPAALAAADPRIPLVEHVTAGRPMAALAAAQKLRQDAPGDAAQQGVSYLRGRLYELLGNLDQAEDAFKDALAESPDLEPYVRNRLALAQLRGGHPEVAAGLLAPLVSPDAPESLRGPATELFARAVTAGGDCRILRGVLSRRLSADERRFLTALDGHCAGREGNDVRAAQLLCSVLQDARDDDAARFAAEELDDLLARNLELRPELMRRGCDIELLVGLTHHDQRAFDRAIPLLERAAARLTAGEALAAGDPGLEAGYALARSYFWREQFDRAAARFGTFALRTRDLEERARFLYQQARSQELAGQWLAAEQTFRRTYTTAQTGPFAGPALLSAMRIDWRLQLEPQALSHFASLKSHRGSREHAARGALFLASSDLAQRRVDRAAIWLEDARRLDPDTALEVAYWAGRQAEVEAQIGEAQPRAAAVNRAIERYLEVARRDPYHPLAQDARRRLQQAPLATTAAAQARQRTAAGSRDDLFAAWALVGDRALEGRAARSALMARYAADPALRPLYRLERVPVARWPLWGATLDRVPEKLLALGLVDDAAGAVPVHFPADRPDLAYTGGRLLVEAEHARQAILLADRFARALSGKVAAPFQPREVRELLYPLPWAERIAEQAGRFGTDPHLLAGVIREESRFDPRALSPAAARGLTQFVWLTAQRLAAEIGLGAISPPDLYDPKVAITLGAAYLAELGGNFGGGEHQAVAAYNAGPAQARLWNSYCFRGDLGEYYSKTGFTQTRAYLRKVLSSRAIYAELYPDLGKATVPGG